MYEGTKGCEKVTLPVNLNSKFIIGPEGAHLNISGISGLASKTSYAMFLMKAIQDSYLSKTRILFVNPKQHLNATVDFCEIQLQIQIL